MRVNLLLQSQISAENSRLLSSLTTGLSIVGHQLKVNLFITFLLVQLPQHLSTLAAVILAAAALITV
jgi:hypothetical protein